MGFETVSVPFNGPPRELRMGPGQDGDIDDDKVYCVACGNIFVWADGRDCPTCTLAEELGIDD